MKKILMKDAEQFRDTVSSKLCNCLYDACNEFLFEFTTPIMFSVHMNMRLEQDFFRPLKFKQLHICYMVYVVEKLISPSALAKEWSSLFLKRCGISEAYYKSHRLDDARSDVLANIEFRESIDNAIQIWEEMRRVPR